MAKWNGCGIVLARKTKGLSATGSKILSYGLVTPNGAGSICQGRRHGRVDRRSVRPAGATEASDPRRRKNRTANARVCPFLANGKRHNGVAVRASRCETTGVVQEVPLGR